MKRVALFLMIIFGFGLFLSPALYAEDQDIQFVWNYDNESYDTVTGFNVYMKDNANDDYPSAPFMTISRDDACQDDPTECCMLATVDGPHFFAVTAHNETLESDKSNDVEYIPYVLPAPSNLKIRFTWEIPANQ